MTTQPATIRPIGYLELVRENPNFRNLWFGQIVSLLGDWFNLIASAALVAMLTESGLAVGGLFVIRMMAQFFASPIGGVLADRYNRKKLLIATDILRALIVLGFLFIQEPSQVWLLYALTAAQLALGGIFVPARDAILPDVVESNEIGPANALSSATWSTMLALGAALGGFVAGEWGLKPAFVIDSLTFIVSAFFISRVSYRPAHHAEIEAQADGGFIISNLVSQYAQGLQYLKANREILILALQKASMALGVTSAFQVIQVNLAGQEYMIGEGGSTSLGIFYALVGIGTGIGPILARYYTGDDHARLRRAIALGYWIAGLGLLIVSTLSHFGIVLFGTLLRGLGVSVGWVFSTQLLLQLLPNRVRGRVISTEFALLTLANASGAALAGWAFDNLGITIPQMLWLMAGLTIALGIFWVFKGLLRTSDDQNRSSIEISTTD